MDDIVIEGHAPLTDRERAFVDALAEVTTARDQIKAENTGLRAEKEGRLAAERHIDVMREAVMRLKPLARRAITEPGASGDKARRELHAAIDWIGRGCPAEQNTDAA